MNKNKKAKIKKTLKMNKCRYCKKKPPEVEMTLDHKVPICRGGDDNPKNLQCLCKDCNQIKGSITNGEIIRIITWYHEKILSQGRTLNKKFK